MPSTENRAGRAFLELELISHKELADMVSWHERNAEWRTEQIWRKNCMVSFETGREVGRCEMMKYLSLALLGGAAIGVLIGVLS